MCARSSSFLEQVGCYLFRFTESFEIKDIRSLQNDILSRAVGRIADSGGKMKHTIENATITRVVLVEGKIHIIARYKDYATARNAII